ncbi:hypothetical protein [Nocardia brasiliensis]|uniref:hypothetical protein n=1 Tax=Nocardia brasiliensis TaxID=37326 RepID=UPI0024557D91|nr:hypothetical protein [Nocardia brasiliensis]
MSTDLKAILRRDERRRKMLHDPDLSGDLLLLALALDEVCDIRKDQGRRWFRANWVEAIEDMVCRDYPGRPTGWWVKHQIAEDMPRYEVAGGTGRKCNAPVLRRSGVTNACGATGSVGLTDRDPFTGEGVRVWACKAHKAFAAEVQARDRQWFENGRPSPPPNAGGVLERYFSGNWDALYRWAAPWKEPLRGGREATPPRPTLRLIQGGEMEAKP